MFEKFISFFSDAIKTILTEKFKIFRSGFLAGSAISLPFLFHLQGLPTDLIWLFPLKLFMSVTFSFATGIAAKSSADVYSYFKEVRRIRKIKHKNNAKRKNDREDRAA